MADKAEVLEAAMKEAVDLENIPIEEVFENLRCITGGLTSEAAQERLSIFVVTISLKKKEKFLNFLGLMWNLLSWGKPPCWQAFFGIVILLIINSTISFIEENNARNTAAALMSRVSPKAKVLRDGRWSEEDAVILVDVISIKLGDIIPADARILSGDPLKIEQVFLLFLMTQ
ncbi:hypothetical protein AQUCO_07400101v1 [Aquilegia coerulea]|uniref:P-type ATPase A domain-containing protein n=1 Tax=Aquilegia coerulea TaxID=218851 RepID=A0A2G5C9S4_AQUCA|nr:hypothetical protein AQUCO_07400101v1 [Aquilegia coerulea]PIA28015.1 hypothetical protein AQUCO_07400101v1 [Aquilegia coerulea]